ncbi:Hypothetical predicted protein [Olea europaea subsp. europaea]|uniref:Uncharacterized protein n=1 Tax=Olea europaea subsp. europaea TaxID=158383 RepID=A0A8S0TTF9_OLEEU|nr:Hypothetical predicted protein [Olea europaea subsp. europaea]
MNSPIALNRHHSTNPIPILQNPKPYKSYKFSNVKLPCTIFTNSFKTFSSLNNRFTVKFPYKTRNFELNRLRASSNDAQSIAGTSSFDDQNEVREPSFLEFITSERVKVVTLLALALALCNADRVVMSVAIVPLSLSHGWRQSFAGVVQGVSSEIKGSEEQNKGSTKDPFEDMDDKEQIDKFQKYEADYKRYLMSKYFSDKTIFGGNIFDVKMNIDGQTITASSLT